MHEGRPIVSILTLRLPRDTIKEFDSGAKGEKKAGSRQLEVERKFRV